MSIQKSSEHSVHQIDFDLKSECSVGISGYCFRIRSPCIRFHSFDYPWHSRERKKRKMKILFKTQRKYVVLGEFLVLFGVTVTVHGLNEEEENEGGIGSKLRKVTKIKFRFKNQISQWKNSSFHFYSQESFYLSLSLVFIFI